MRGAKHTILTTFAHAYRVGVRNMPDKQSAVQFTRNQLDRLGGSGWMWNACQIVPAPSLEGALLDHPPPLYEQTR